MYDVLHGDVRIKEPFYKIVETPEFQNMYGIALTSLTELLAPVKRPKFMDKGHSLISSRADHSIGVYYLVGKYLMQHPELDEHALELMAAGLLHDIGSISASHNNEFILKKITEKNHEQYARDVIMSSRIKEILSESVSVERVCKIIDGTDDSVSRLINNLEGKYPDFDSGDNVSRFTLAYLDVNNAVLPDLNKLIGFTKLNGNLLEFDKQGISELEKHNKCRWKIYEEYIHNLNNASIECMLNYSLALVSDVKGQKALVDDDYLKFNDFQLISYIKEADSTVKNLIEQAEKGNHYAFIAGVSTREPSKNMKNICEDLSARREYSDGLAQHFGFLPGEFIVHAFKRKSKKEKNPPYDLKAFVEPSKAKSLSGWKLKRISNELNNFANN